MVKTQPTTFLQIFPKLCFVTIQSFKYVSIIDVLILISRTLGTNWLISIHCDIAHFDKVWLEFIFDVWHL